MVLEYFRTKHMRIRVLNLWGVSIRWFLPNITIAIGPTRLFACEKIILICIIPPRIRVI